MNWDLNHISAYALTVEPKTALEKYIKKEIILPLDEEFVYDQFNLMCDKLLDLNYINYELSSFAKKGYFSKNNSGYWLGKKYVGIGPSSHSFDGFSNYAKQHILSQYRGCEIGPAQCFPCRQTRP